MGAPLTQAEVVAGVTTAIAAATQALDDGRTDDIVATYCVDGTCEIPGRGTHVGHEALSAAYAGWAPTQPQRHLVTNTLVTDWDDHQARAVSDLVFMLQGDRGWKVQLVGRYHDLLCHDAGTWRFHHRRAEFVQ
ncbi:MAG: nuclear transport factor 2 family protein [Acidimicrobiales bacterium]